MYVLVLGLDVLGNPFGVIRGLGTGVQDLFYEPYQVSNFAASNTCENIQGCYCCSIACRELFKGLRNLQKV